MTVTLLRAAPALLALACLSSPLFVPQAKADVGRVWTYGENNGGYFEDRGGGKWVEFVNNGPTTFYFREVRRTQNSVLLYDESRVLWVEIFETTSRVRHSGTDGWVFLYHGRWR